MKKLYCKKCGHKTNSKFLFVPNRCVCGANLNEWEEDTGRSSLRYLLCLLLLMLPLFLIVYLLRNALRNSILFFAFILVISMIWLRLADGLFVRLGIVKMKNIFIK